VSEPDDPTPADYLRKLSAARSPAEVMAVVREINERPPVPYRMAHETLRAYFGTGALNLTREGSLVAAGTMAAAVETLTVEAVVTATGEVIRPALTRLPTDAKNQLWGYITELGGAIWLINKITKS